MNQSHTQPLPASRAATRSERILFVLNEKEWELFLPRFSSSDMDALGGTWVDTQTLRPGDWLRILEEERPTVLVTAWSSPSLPEEWVNSVDLPLRYVCHITGSVRKIVSRALISRGVVVTNWGSVISHTIAEHAMLLVLGTLRNVPAWRANTGPDCDDGSAFEKMQTFRTRSLRGKRVGLHGFGAIARELVHMLRPFQVDLAAWSPHVPRALYEEFGVTQMPSLEALFSRSDVLIECEGLTPATRASVSKEVLRLLPEDAVFVNVGRSAVTDEEALAAMGDAGRLRVGLDVFTPAAGTMQRGLLSPHIAGPTWDTYPLCGDFALENVDKYLRGETPEAVMSLEVYDRST
ncbi:MAG: NAD(P)-dependent oxidoreductase [Candidatus Methylacidiphilales bacterium]|nr:NAD(P)-dependent oxidoreductase [Candidatus Methylacidiphilales bacterium]